MWRDLNATTQLARKLIDNFRRLERNWSKEIAVLLSSRDCNESSVRDFVSYINIFFSVWISQTRGDAKRIPSARNLQYLLDR
jgi:hypothetical protein